MYIHVYPCVFMYLSLSEIFIMCQDVPHHSLNYSAFPTQCFNFNAAPRNRDMFPLKVETLLLEKFT